MKPLISALLVPLFGLPQAASACEIEIANESQYIFAVVVHLETTDKIVGPNLGIALPDRDPQEIELPDLDECHVPLVFEILQERFSRWESMGRIAMEPRPDRSLDNRSQFVITDLDVSPILD